jgi:hypothetical protein
MTGLARDIRTGAGGPDDVTVLAEASVAAGFDMSRQLSALETTPAATWTKELIGARAGGGFRRHLAGVVPGAEAGIAAAAGPRRHARRRPHLRLRLDAPGPPGGP